MLGASARRWAGWLLVACAAVVAVLGVLFANHTTPGGFDRAVDSQVIAWLGGHRGALPRLADVGTQIPAAVFSAVIVAACLLSGRLNGAVLAAAAVLAADGLDEGLLKPLVHRTYRGGVVYPSGHTTTIFALAATLTVLLVMSPRPATPRAVRALIPAAAYVLGCVVAVAVIALRWHYFTDTVAGAAVGIGIVCGLALILDLPVISRWLARAGRRLPAGQERPIDPARAGAGRGT